MSQVLPTVKDDSRPFFNRSPGCIGINIVVYDATPVNPENYGSGHFFKMELNEKLLAAYQSLPPHRLKGALERKQLMSGGIIQGFSDQGLIMEVTFENANAVEFLWKNYDDKLIQPVLEEALSTDEIAAAVEAEKLEVRVKLWRDEFDECVNEVASGTLRQPPLAESAMTRRMLREAREYQKGPLCDAIQACRDGVHAYEQSLGGLIQVYKRNLPPRVERISSFSQFVSHMNLIKQKKTVPIELFQNYLDLVQQFRDLVTNHMQDEISHRLLLVHPDYESVHQRECKARIVRHCEDILKTLDPEADFGKVRYDEWLPKMLLREQRIFMGLVSVAPVTMEGVLELDRNLDEYLGGIPKEHLV